MTVTSLRMLGYQALFGWLHLVLALPSIYLLLGLPLVMREQGWSGTDIGLFQLVGLPAVLKFLLAAPVERWRFGSGHYRGWAMLLSLLLAVTLAVIGWMEGPGSRGGLFALAFLAGLLATWADIPANALAIKLLPESERLRAGAIRSAALFLAAILGGGVMLVVHSRWGWSAPFLLMAAALVVGAILLAVPGEAPETGRKSAAASVEEGGWRGYFAQPGAKRWTCLLLTAFPFIGAAWLYLKPLMLDLGMPAEQVAWLVGVGGGTLGALASVIGGRMVRHLGPGRAMPLFTGLCLCALVVLTAMVWRGAGTAGLLLGAALVAVALGAISSLLFGLMMYFTRPRRCAADYGLQASLFVMTRLSVPVAAGVLLDRLGHDGMLLGLTLAALGVWGLAVDSRRILARVAKPVGRGGATQGSDAGAVSRQVMAPGVASISGERGYQAK